MPESLITSKTRIKILLKFFMNPNNKAHLRSLAEEFNESTNGVRVELNRLTEAGLLQKTASGRTIQYQANTKHSLFVDIQNIVKKYIGIDKLIGEILAKLGRVELALITGDYARGMDTGIIDLVVVGDVDKIYLQQLINKTEKLISRKIRSMVLNGKEFQQLEEKLQVKQALVVWGQSEVASKNRNHP